MEKSYSLVSLQLDPFAIPHYNEPIKLIGDLCQIKDQNPSMSFR